MALIKFTPDTVGRPKKMARLRIVRRGPVTLSKSLAETLGVAPGDGVTVLYDDVAKEWYICKDAGGFTLRDSGKDLGLLMFNNSVFAGKILDALKLDKNSYQITVAGVPTEVEGNQCFALLTSSARD